MNVGASAPEEAGLYFSWGNTDGHAEESGHDFSQAVYDETAAAAIDSDLSLGQDMARANLGTPWRMPTKDDFRELYENCSMVWTSQNGVNGYLFTSNVNGNKLFFPAVGIYIDKAIVDHGEVGFYWSSSYLSDSNANIFYLSKEEIIDQDEGIRYQGSSVRAVQ